MLNFHIYDVFTDTAYAGNPLAIVEDAQDLSTEQMQTIAREFNLSETIFILPAADPTHTARVRIFTPAHEMPFAGHPTIGCALHLAAKNGGGLIKLEEEAGLVPVTIAALDGRPLAEFTAPVSPRAEPLELTAAQLADALGLSPDQIGPHQAHILHGGHPFVHIALQDLAALSQSFYTYPGFQALSDAAGTGSVYVYAPGQGRAAYQARMFAPEGGIGEDPATGSATSLLAGQLLANGALAEGTTTQWICQGRDMGRESWLRLSADVTDGSLAAVRVAGMAVPVSRGQIAPPG